jgi:antitoxin YefM
MRLINYSEARNSLKAVLDATVDDADVTVITRRDGPDAVVMSFDQYNSIMATLHLLSSPDNAAHLAKSIREYRQGKAKPRNLTAH